MDTILQKKGLTGRGPWRFDTLPEKVSFATAILGGAVFAVSAMFNLENEVSANLPPFGNVNVPFLAIIAGVVGVGACLTMERLRAVQNS